MTSISSVGGSAFGSHVSRTKRGEGPEQGLQRDLTDFLTKQGVSTEDQKSILSDIKNAISASGAGPGTRFDPNKIQSTVTSVLEKHGVNAGEFSKQFPVPSATHSSRHLPSGTGKESNESIQQILDVLSQQSEKTRLRTKQAEPSTANASPINDVPATETNKAVGNHHLIHAAYASTNSSIAPGTTISFKA